MVALDGMPLRSIGPYILEELLGRGGMAEVYRARREGPAGFEKVVALKRILPSYAGNPKLVERFLEEARIAGALDHGNIVHVIDFGTSDGEYYLVMEWVDGVPLSAVLRTLADRGKVFPPEVLAHVVSEAAVGLHYAHTRADPAGRPLCIVHRDVSPQNILLSRQGDVKINDFGIAKAADSVVRTDAGIQVGKLCYMAPEQARGDPLDARSDVYALAIVLWEGLTMRPLFPREEGGEALRAVLEPSHRAPSEVAASAPAVLDAVVLSALMPDRQKRYPDADSFARDLRVYLHGVAPGFGKSDLAAFLERTMPFSGGLPRASLPAPAPPVASPPAAAAPARSSLRDTRQEVPRTRSRTRRALRVWLAAGGALAVLAVVAGASLGMLSPVGGGSAPPMSSSLPSPAPAPAPPRAPDPAQAPLGTSLVPSAPKIRLHIDTVPAGAQIVLDGDPAGATPLYTQAELGTPLRLGLLLRGFEPLLFPLAPDVYPQFVDSQPAPPALVLARTRETFGLVDVSCRVEEARVIADGADLGVPPVLVVIRFAGGIPAPVTRVEVELPDGTRSPLSLGSAIPWGFASIKHIP